MKKFFLLFVIPVLLHAQIPPGYYNSAAGLKGNNLKIALYNIIKNHTVISYSGLWTAFQKTDKKTNGKVWDIYSYKPVGAQPYEYTFVTNQCGSYNSESDCYNREHTWPQSWFNSTPGPDSDLFHIYPSDGYVNNVRSNFPYGKVTSASYTSQNGSKLGPCVSAGYNQTVFEPIDEFKGDLARSYFYMTTRYYSEDASWGTSDATNKATILSWQLNLLMQWHHQDPVSAKEIARNDSIYYKYQANRNPFIDHPEYADSIWAFTTDIQELKADARNYFSVFPNPSESNFVLLNHSGSTLHIHYTLKQLNGALVKEEELNIEEYLKLETEGFAQGIYVLTVSSEIGTANLKLIRN